MSIPESFIKKLPALADKYIEECLENTKEAPTNSGKVLKLMDRHIPTIQFFLRIWLPKEAGKAIHRGTWYLWINLEESDEFTKQKNAKIKLKMNTIKNISELFDALAVDIVANEGKGIFFAKNKLGMSDQTKTKIEATIKTLEPITGMNIVDEVNDNE